MRAEVDRGLAALLAVTALAYFGSLAGPFQFDDYAVVATDRAAQDWVAWWETLSHRIRPLLKASYVATHQLGGWLGHETLGHHLGNLLVHGCVVAAAWRLALILALSFGMPAGVAKRAALGTAAVVALHPLATEAVTYISGRSVALGTLFALLAAVAQLRDRRALAAAAFVAALLSRETLLVLPALLALLEWARGDARGPAFSGDRAWWALRRTAAPWAIAAVAAVAIALHRRYGPLFELSASISDGRLASPSLLLPLEYFATRFLLLAPPSIDPAIQPESIGAAHRAIASAFIVVAWTLAWRTRSSRPWWLLAMAWSSLILAPMYLVPLRHDGVSERHFYPVLWGIGLALSCELACRKEATLATLAAAAAAIVLSLSTMMRNADYRSEVALWDATSRGAGAGPRAFNNLGVAYLGEHRWDEAQAAFERALALDGGYTKALENRERALQGRLTGDPFAEPEI